MLKSMPWEDCAEILRNMESYYGGAAHLVESFENKNGHKTGFDAKLRSEYPGLHEVVLSVWRFQQEH